MKKMINKKLSSVLCLFFVLSVLVLPTLSSPAFAATSSQPKVIDDAGLLSGEERKALTARLEEISQANDCDVVVVTVNSTEGLTPMEFADDYYDYNGYSPDGVLLLVSMEARDWWISTKGFGITAVTDWGIRFLEDTIVSDLGDEYYADAFTNFGNTVEKMWIEAKKGTPYDVNHTMKTTGRVVLTFVIAWLIAIALALVIVLVMRSKLNSVKPQKWAGDYIRPGSFQLTVARELYLYRTVSRTRRQSENSGGGSSTHTSSSGSSHGGGGGKF